MVSQQIIDYIQKMESQGYKPKQIRDALVNQGYAAPIVDEAIKEANQNGSAAELSDKPIDAKQVQGIKKRNPLLVLLFTLITFGIYAVFWMIFTTIELRQNTKSAPNPLLLLLIFIPIINIVVGLYYYYKYSKALNELTGAPVFGVCLLMILFLPIGMILAQIELNKKAA